VIHVKIGGVYILSRRSIARMLATITAALMMFYASATAQAESTIRRIHDATISLVSLDRQMTGRLVRTAFPDFMYLEYKSLYLELRPFRDFHGRVPPIVREPVASGAAAAGRPPHPAARRDASSYPMAATKADLRAAVKTILRGEDVNAAKPGPRLTSAKRRQIEAAEAYRKGHAGCSLHNACIRSFVPAKGGYTSGKAMFVVLNRKGNN
jgi:hypothetical protein